MYPVDGRSLPVQLRLTDIPSGWRIATALGSGQRRISPRRIMINWWMRRLKSAHSRSSDFDQGGGHYRVVADADPDDYEMEEIVADGPAHCDRRDRMDERPSL